MSMWRQLRLNNGLLASEDGASERQEINGAGLMPALAFNGEPIISGG
jgi:hypothetical protein